MDSRDLNIAKKGKNIMLKNAVNKVANVFTGKKIIGTSSKSKSRQPTNVQINTDNCTHVDDTPYDINNLNIPLDHEYLHSRYDTNTNANTFDDDDDIDNFILNDDDIFDDDDDETQPPTATTPNPSPSPTPVPPVYPRGKVERKKKSVVWQFMTQNEDKTKAICKKCKYVLNHKTTGKQGGTGHLRNHLLGCCKNEFLHAVAVADA